VKEEEKNRSVEKQIQNGREKKKNPRNGLDRNGLKSTACVFFLVCRSPSVQKGRGEEAVTDPPCFHGGAWVHAPQWWCAWRRRAATSQMPRNLPATVPAVAEGLPCNSCRFWGVCFVIFKLNLIF
jgi:hypothetical protein